MFLQLKTRRINADLDSSHNDRLRGYSEAPSKFVLPY